MTKMVNDLQPDGLIGPFLTVNQCKGLPPDAVGVPLLEVFKEEIG